jgi:hypothetical protein
VNLHVNPKNFAAVAASMDTMGATLRRHQAERDAVEAEASNRAQAAEMRWEQDEADAKAAAQQSTETK